MQTNNDDLFKHVNQVTQNEIKKNANENKAIDAGEQEVSTKKKKSTSTHK